MDPKPHHNNRILIIDDNKAIHDDFRKILGKPEVLSDKFKAVEEELFGGTSSQPELPVFEIDSAFQGQEGLELVEKAIQEKRPYSMAFVDVRMPPGWDGVETCKSSSAPPIPTIPGRTCSKTWGIPTGWSF
jgi:CheY-like chemotaxis protein